MHEAHGPGLDSSARPPRRRAPHRADDALVDARTAVEGLRGLGLTVAPGTIRSWAARGQLKRCGVDHRGRTLYRADDIYLLATRQLAAA